MLAAPDVLRERLLVFKRSSLERDLIAFVAVIDEGHVTLLCQFNSFAIGILIKTPEERAHAVCLPMIKAVGTALLGNVLDTEIGGSAQSLHHLIKYRFGFPGVLLVDRNTLAGLGRC